MTTLMPERPRRLVDPSLDLSDAQFAVIAQRIHQETGIVIGPDKRSMMISRLAHRLRHLGLANFAAYIKLLNGPEGQTERDGLISAITTNVTDFFREPHHFEALAELAPDLVARARAGGRVRIWSAGCSTGQEAYSIAATLLDRAPDLAQHDLRILATDIDPVVIETARRGLYHVSSLKADMPPLMGPFLHPARDQKVAVSDKLATIIRFERLNLLGHWPFTGKFDLIFCRNVVIYFDAETRYRLLRRFAGRLVPGGQLFVGHSERIDGRLEDYFVVCGISRYRRSSVDIEDTGAPFPKDAN